MDRDRIEELCDELVRERSMEALESLTGSKHERVLAALIDAAGEILDADTPQDEDDTILEEIQGHLVKCSELGPLVDSLESARPSVKEFVLGCLGEIGDPSAAEAMINCIEDPDQGVREAAAEHLSLLTDHDYGLDVIAWRKWLEAQDGLAKQREEDEREESRQRAKAKAKVLDVKVDEDEDEGSDGGGARRRDEDDESDDDDDRPRSRRDEDDESDEDAGAVDDL
jgi:hypothetical protein